MAKYIVMMIFVAGNIALSASLPGWYAALASVGCAASYLLGVLFACLAMDED